MRPDLDGFLGVIFAFAIGAVIWGFIGWTVS
jgi:preprotein translocase subunit Sss1